MARAFRIISVVAAALLAHGCTVSPTRAPALSGPSGFALSVTLTATPDSLAQDGQSRTTIVVTAFDPAGQPVGGKGFRLYLQPYGVNLVGEVFACEVLLPGSLSSSLVTTSGDGRATVQYTAPATNQYCSTGERIDQVTIVAVPIGNDYVADQATAVTVQLVPYTVLNPEAPLADFVYSPTAPAVGAFVYFNGGASQAAAGHYLVAYEWDYGDGTFESGITQTHDFVAAGTYYVTLTVTDEAGRTATRRKAITVTGAAPAP